MAEAEHKIVEKIEGLEAKSPIVGVLSPEELERVAPNKDHFDALLAVQSNAIKGTDLSETSPQKVELLEEIREVGGRVDLLKRKTPEEILAQTKDVIAQVDDIKMKLRTPGLELNPGEQLAMRNRLSHVDDKLRVVMEQVGGEYTPLEVKEARAGLGKPIERFLGMVENSESQLKHVFYQVSLTGSNRESFSPQAMLMLQVKMGFIQQELEFFTAVLNKSLESTKTLMNVQV